MKATPVIYVDPRGEEHDALVRSVNGLNPGYMDIVYVDADAPESDNLKTVFGVAHVDSKKESNPALPVIHLNVWKEKYEPHTAPAVDHPMFDHPFAEKAKDEFGKAVEPERPEYAAQVAAHKSPDLKIETKEYSDGSSATGVAPLPDHSPAQQEAAGKKGGIRVVKGSKAE